MALRARRLSSFGLPLLLAVSSLAGGTLIFAACGGDDDDPSTNPNNNPDGSGGDGNPNGSDGAPNPSQSAPKITTASSLPPLVAFTAASVKLEATGATPITWAITTGTPPAGLALSGGGVLSGTPTTPGDSTFTVTATNSIGTDSVSFTQKVSATPDAILLLDSNRISVGSTKFPALAPTPVAIAGVVTGEVLVSIDRRPYNGQLYGLGLNATTKQVSFYAIHPAANVAVPLTSPQAFDTDVVGPVFGMDFNPAVDRVRVVTSAGQNFRINPNNGTVLDTDLVTPGNQRDTAINGPATTASETAYTNNTINNGNVTTQYTLSGTTLYIQNPSNNGTLTTAVNCVPALESIFGFDIAPGVNVAGSNLPAAGIGLAAVKITGQAAEQLASINLTTGAVTSLGNFPFTGTRGFTLLTPPNTRTVLGLSADGTQLIRFLENTPATVTTQAINNIVLTEQLVGIDFRPATGQLIGFGVNATANTGTLYLIDPQTGGATVIGATSGISFVNAAVPIDLPDPATAAYAFNFDPSIDRARVHTSTGLNFRIHPVTGAPVDSDATAAGNNPDASLNGGSTELHAASYTNGHPVTPGTLTTEYALNATTNALHIVTNPSGGVVGAAINVTLGGAPLDFTAVSGFDIPQSVLTSAANASVVEGTGYAALTVGASTGLYKINLVNGAATLVGPINAGTAALRSITVGQ